MEGNERARNGGVNMNCLVIVGLFLLAMILFEALLLINQDEDCDNCDKCNYKKQIQEILKKEKKRRRNNE